MSNIIASGIKDNHIYGESKNVAKKKKSLLDRKQKFARKEKGTEQSKMSEFIAAFVLLF